MCLVFRILLLWESRHGTAKREVLPKRLRQCPRRENRIFRLIVWQDIAQLVLQLLELPVAHRTRYSLLLFVFEPHILAVLLSFTATIRSHPSRSTGHSVSPEVRHCLSTALARRESLRTRSTLTRHPFLVSRLSHVASLHRRLDLRCKCRRSASAPLPSRATQTGSVKVLAL